MDESGVWDAIVIGAGPGGASAAFTLARLGRRVLLLDRKTFPRDKSCGDGLTPYCIRLLDDMSVLSDFAASPRVAGVRVIHRERTRKTREFSYEDLPGPHNYGLVVPRLELDDAMFRAACRAGAGAQTDCRVRGLIQDGGRIVGCEAETADGRIDRLFAKAIIAADGAQSRFARHVRRKDEAPAELGTAIRGYFGGIAGLGRHQEIYMPLTDPSGDYVLPSYGWVFPIDEDSANIGVGLFKKVPFENVRNLYDRFIRSLMQNDARFAVMRKQGASLGAPLRFDFDPKRCAAAGILLVGDAAGLTSPFSGEGISYAIESGRIAAESIDRALRFSPECPSFEEDYVTLMEHQFAGYFETGQRAAPRHQLLWQVLDSSFESERPLFAMLRRLVLVPEAAGGSSELLDDVAHLMPRGDPLFRNQLFEAGSTLIANVRKEWPFLGRLEQARHKAGMFGLRPSVLALLAARSGDPGRPQLPALAAALDLAYAGQIAQSGVDEDVEGERPGNWSNKFAILLSDYLLASAVSIVVGHDCSLAARFLQFHEISCRSHLAQFGSAWDIDQPLDRAIDLLADQAAPMFELPCMVGAAASGASDPAIAALSSYGRTLAIAVALAEQRRVLMTETPQPLTILVGDTSEGFRNIPLLLAARQPDCREILAEQSKSRAIEPAILRALPGMALALDEVMRMVVMHAEGSVQALASLPRSPARTTLEALARHVAGTATRS